VKIFHNNVNLVSFVARASSNCDRLEDSMLVFCEGSFGEASQVISGLYAHSNRYKTGCVVSSITQFHQSDLIVKLISLN
jgi:hypothetical protein